MITVKQKPTTDAELAEIDSNMGFSHMSTELTETKFGKTPVGSVLSYQTSFTESNVSVEADITAVPRITVPRFPVSN